MQNEKNEAESRVGSSSDVYIASDYMVSGKPIASPQKGGSMYVCNGMNIGSVAQALSITDGAVNCASLTPSQALLASNAKVELFNSRSDFPNTSPMIGDGFLVGSVTITGGDGTNKWAILTCTVNAGTANEMVGYASAVQCPDYSCNSSFTLPVKKGDTWAVKINASSACQFTDSVYIRYFGNPTA